MAAQAPAGDQLSAESRTALRWAAASARSRRGARSQGPDLQVDEFDLLVGLILAGAGGTGTSEPVELLAHLGVSAREVLPSGYPAPSRDLDDHLRALDPSQPPLLAPGAEEAVSLASTAASGALGPGALFGGLLQGTSNGVGVAFRRLLDRAGIPDVVTRYREYLARSPDISYERFLQEWHRFEPRPPEIPRYSADRVNAGEDLLDIGAEVDAFAHLLASKDLRPPLAVGLFGEWGSGKSFFMQAVRQRIGDLVRAQIASPDAGQPFWEGIVQIDFNAWHYMDGDLWASLVEHVFARLGGDEDVPDGPAASRRRELLRQVDGKLLERIELEKRIVEATRRREDADREWAQARERAAREEARLAQERAAALAPEPVRETVMGAVRSAVAGLTDVATEGTAGEALEAIHEARAQVTRAAALSAIPRDPSRIAVTVAALVGVPLLVALVAQFDAIPTSAQFFAGVSALLGLVAATLKSVTDSARKRLDALDAAEKAVNEEIDRRRREARDAVEQAQATAAQARDREQGLSRRREGLDREVAALRRRADTVSATEMISEFVAERVGSTDYRARLGTAALIQRDFTTLARLIHEQNAQADERATRAADGPRPLNRIILYVDDLDRCEPERVIRVLQAVHLMLAFDLFVVVVAVDSRWLAHSLEEHYPVLTGASATSSARANGQRPPDDDPSWASATDYLEKIFQIPFWVEPLTPRARRSLVRGLLQSSVVADDAGPTEQAAADTPAFSDQMEATVESVFAPSRGGGSATVAAMTLTSGELAYLDELAPLLGDTPRSIKRFTNTYQLLCALPVPRDMGPDDYQELVGLLLALADGHPAVFRNVLARIPPAHAPPDGAAPTLGQAIRFANPPREFVAAFGEWATDRPVVSTSLDQLRETANRVARFSFARPSG